MSTACESGNADEFDAFAHRFTSLHFKIFPFGATRLD
jgi:hypothetical protein